MKKITSALLALLVLLSLPLTAFAYDASVVYSGHNIFGFGPGSEFTETDLFDNFKGVMPGDVRTQTIRVKNTAMCCDFIKLYIRAEVHNGKNPLSEAVAQEESIASMEDFLSQLSMKVWDGKDLIFDASPEKLDGMKENVCLAKLRSGKSTTLKVELTVPAGLDNEYADRVGEVDWVFTVEEFDDRDPENPKTGDHTPIGLYLTVMAVSLVLLAALLLLAKRKKKQQ